MTGERGFLDVQVPGTQLRTAVELRIEKAEQRLVVTRASQCIDGVPGNEGFGIAGNQRQRTLRIRLPAFDDRAEEVPGGSLALHEIQVVSGRICLLGLLAGRARIEAL